MKLLCADRWGAYAPSSAARGLLLGGQGTDQPVQPGASTQSSHSCQPQVAPASNSSKKLWVVVRDLATSGHKPLARTHVVDSRMQARLPSMWICPRLSESDVIKPVSK